MNILYTRMRLNPGRFWLLWVLLALAGSGLTTVAQAQCPAIDKATVSGCYYANGQSLATVSVQVSWGSVNAGTGNITVTLFRGATVVGTRIIVPGPITVTYTPTLTGAQTIVSPQVVAFDVPANGAALTLSVARSGCATITNTQPIQAPSGCAPTTCTGNGLGGAVYYDFDANGQRAVSETVGVPNVTVTAYPKAGAPLTTTTDAFGQFNLAVPPTSYPVRLEYTQIPQFLSGGRSGPNGSGSRTTVQFLSAPTCQANLGVLNQNEFCDANPIIMTPCYVNGDPLVAGTAGTDPAMVGLPYNSTGRAPAKTFMVPNSSLGATWATAYNKSTKRLFTSAVVRRHAGLGPLGIGGIYQLDLSNPSAPVTTNFLDVVNDLGINVGSIGSNAARGMVGDKAAKSNDPQAFTAVGKVGIGGMDFSDDNSKLYFTNVFDNTVYEIDMSAYNLGGPKPTAANVKLFPIPDPGCVGGSRRSWALKVSRGYVYAGVVCDASTSTKSNMISYVYQLDPATGAWKQAFSIPMTYPKGWAGGVNITGWFPWSDDFAVYPQPSAGLVLYHQPMLTDIEFDVDGSMVLGYGDRGGMQFSAENYGPTGTTILTTVSGGDMLRAYLSNGTFILENNAKAGPATGYKPNNNQGPGFGEFYNDDLLMTTDPNYLGHAENALGGLALKPGSGEVVATIMDPINLPNATVAGDFVWANGVRRLSNSTGGVNDAFIVYQRYVNGVLTGPGTSGKATGLGDIELACAQAQYIELGNRLWKDANRNGVQDADEQPMAGVQLQLYKGPTLVASTTTNAAGEYYFSTLLGHTILPNTTYNILFGAGQFNSTTQEMTVGGNKYKLTTPDVGQGSNPEQNDSDADPNVLSTALGARPGGVPQIVVTTGDYGFVDHSFDAGVYCSDVAASVSAVAATCNGSTNNNDGKVEIVSATSATHYAVSVGSSFTGVSFTAATPMSGFPVAVISNAPNTGQVYTVRLFNGSDDCVLDVIVNVPQSCTINSCTAVGGTVVYSGSGALCATSNIGSLTVTGSAGNVVRWQTSTTGGASWNDLPNTAGQAYYTFMNAQNGQQYRAVLNTATGCPDVYATPVTLSVSSSACTSGNCDTRTGSLSVTTSGPGAGAGQTSRLVAVDPTGVIRAVSTANGSSLSNVPTGDYLVYQVVFDNAQPPTLTVGTAVSATGGVCVRWSNGVLMKVCSAAPTVTITSPTAGTTLTTTTPAISGTATPNAVVTITGGPGSTGGPVSVTADNNGNWTTTGITFPSGPNTVTAVATTPAGGNSLPASTSFTTAAAPTLVVDPTIPGPPTQPITGTATPGSKVTITDPTGNTLCQTTASSNGTFACTITVPANVTNVIVTACNTAGCTSKTAVVSVVPVPTIAVDPVPTIATVTPTISGTATPGALVAILGPGSTTLCSTTATQTGSYSCTVNVAPGPQTLTAVATNPGGSASATTNSFTAVGSPTLVVDPVGKPGPLTQPLTGTATPGSQVVITDPAGRTLCATTVGSSGTFSCPVSLTAGVNTLTVTACNASGCTSLPVSRTALPVPSIGVDPVPTIATLTPTVSGTATPGALVTILGPNSTTLCSTTATQTGSYSCTVSVSPGPQALTAVATNPGGSASALTNSFTAVGPPSLTVAQPTTPTRLTDPITGTATPGSQIVITDPTGNTVCATTASSSGTFSCGVSLTAGVNNLTVTACNASGCISQPTSRTAVPVPSIGITGPTNTTATTSPTVSGTATPGALVAILGPNSTTLCSTTATQAGTYSCVVNVPGGVNSLTAVASNPGGSASAVTSFTAVGSPSLVVDPLVPGQPTQPVTGTTTPGSQVVITDPTGNTLCQTTASASGTFTCTVTLPTNVTSVVVTACNTAGCTSKTAVMAGVPAPTIAVDPMPTVATLTPTVSGTATPGALVAILGPNSTTLCSTTATQTGSYSCTVSVAPGPQTLTAVASNPGGSASAVTNSFTAVGVPTLVVDLVGKPGPLTQPLTGTATPGSQVVITDPAGRTLCATTVGTSGTFSCPVNLTSGVNNLTVTACNTAGCTSQPISRTALPAPTVAISSPAPGTTTASLTPIFTGTATPGSVVTVVGGPGSTGGPVSVTADPSGNWTATGIRFPAGPATATATAGNPGGSSLPASTSFTASGGAPTLVVNPVPPTGPVTGTATPGSQVVITDPTGNTLCQTTASASGTFSCPATLPTSVTSVVVTACNSSTCTSVTALVGPGLVVAPPVPGPLTQPVTGTATPGAQVVITDPAGNTLCQTTASTSGTFSCPVNLTSGVNNLTVTACNASGCISQPTSRTAVPVPTIAVDPVPAIATVTPTISGTATPGALVAILGPGSTTLCSTTATQTGSYSCTVNVAPGPQTLTAVATNPGGSASATTNSFTAVGSPTLIVDPVGKPGPLTQPLTGTATPGSQVVITDPAGRTLCATTVGSSGTFSCPVSLTAGVNTLTVTACNASGCTSLPVSRTALPVPSIGVDPLPTVATLTPTVSGTATPGALVAILGPNSTTLCSTTATQTGSYSCTVSVAPGPQTLTAVATNPGGSASAVTNSFTAVGSPSLVVDPLVPGQPTQPVTGTTTPGSKVTITDPTGNTLCQTTASASGTFTCTITVPTGATSVVVTACNSTGCTSRTIVVPVTQGTVSLNVKVLLQGALLGVNSGSLMRDDLRTGGYVPLTTPYSATANARFTQAGGGGGETTTPAVLSANAGTPNAIVDWVLVELRSAGNPAQVLATRSGLLQRDGDVVLPADGLSPLSFTGLAGTQYYVAVKHRNHLGAMTATALPLSSIGTTVDFTAMTDAQVYDKPGAVNYDGVEMVTVNGKRALWAGDANADGKVKYVGGGSDNGHVLNDVITAQGAIANPSYNYDFAFGYFFGDLNLNGKAKYQGSVNDPTVVFDNVVVTYPLNMLQLYNYDFMVEQLP
ncbi:Ig-like domain-containing protein [Fibrella aquatilis]|uniref:Uncharacterized protein n=1 Tax=Fibrella aquatilis TaxID=2817059 RepID=A0A939GAC6_9BACT|nr:Ig-like domain-containing protein [Fibrella aquatilis]MBO0933225.1 hypothetical protein [Fibrella aquatilis]